MSVDRKRLAEMFQRQARGRGVTIGRKFAVKVREVLSVQAPTRVTRSGKLVATTKAIPSTPPRMITKKLRESVQVTETKNGCRVRVGAPYGMPLELGKKVEGFPHEFVRRAAQLMGLKLKTRY